MQGSPFPFLDRLSFWWNWSWKLQNNLLLMKIQLHYNQSVNLVPRVLSLLREVEKGPWERGWISATHAPHISHLMFSTFSFSFEGLRVNWDCQRIVLGFLLLHGIYYHCSKVRNISLISFQLTVDFVSTNSLLHVNCFHQGTPPMWVCLFSQKDNLKCLFTVAI